MTVKQVSVIVDLAPLLMNISIMVFIDTVVTSENAVEVADNVLALTQDTAQVADKLPLKVLILSFLRIGYILHQQNHFSI